ncbi:hypothetical protein Acr_06g0006160 [Actinidia rufa]|uniref:Uncharacterized protein n=1 Tax=Actinidia rufa TaxID=165716 RepID=A0A7J0ER55_9ERIC|nr:hypothetical protein Acr_06g0006160 [Actinidia rufa]
MRGRCSIINVDVDVDIDFHAGGNVIGAPTLIDLNNVEGGGAEGDEGVNDGSEVEEDVDGRAEGEDKCDEGDQCDYIYGFRDEDRDWNGMGEEDLGFTDDISLDVEVVPSEEDAISDYHSIEAEGHLSVEGDTNTLVQKCRAAVGGEHWFSRLGGLCWREKVTDMGFLQWVGRVE